MIGMDETTANTLSDFTQRFVALAEEARKHGIRIVVIASEPNPFRPTDDNVAMYHQCSTSEALGLMEASREALLSRLTIKQL